MKIGHPADKPATVAPAGAAGTAADVAKTAPGSAAAASVPATADASATVALSSTAASLLSGGSTAEFDANKVARVSDAIAGGTYKVNPEAIADKLIANAQELLTKVKG